MSWLSAIVWLEGANPSLLPEEPPIDPSRVAPDFLGFVSSALLIAVIIGVVLLTILVIKALRRRPTPPIQRSAPLATGWYPVPDGSGRVAWWDGSKWDDSMTPPNAQG